MKLNYDAITKKLAREIYPYMCCMARALNRHNGADIAVQIIKLLPKQVEFIALRRRPFGFQFHSGRKTFEYRIRYNNQISAFIADIRPVETTKPVFIPNKRFMSRVCGAAR